MAVLIMIALPVYNSPESYQERLACHFPDLDIRIWPDAGNTKDIEVILLDRLIPGSSKHFPNLRLIQKLGAGVDTILTDKELPPDVQIARLKPLTAAQEIIEYCLLYVFAHHRHADQYRKFQAGSRWRQMEYSLISETRVGVLGLGIIGGRVASAFKNLGFLVSGWSRTPKTLDGIKLFHGPDGLKPILSESDYLVAVLPSTPATRNLMDKKAFSNMKPGALFLNVGRGDLVVEKDLLGAIDSGHLSGAVLDVHMVEPLPQDHPYWSHPRVTLTPHIANWHVKGAMADIVENIRRYQTGEPFINLIDRKQGY